MTACLTTNLFGRNRRQRLCSRGLGCDPASGWCLGRGWEHLPTNSLTVCAFLTPKFRRFPRSTAIGHAGQLEAIGNAAGVPVAGMQGRVHLYEGYSAQEVAFPVRVFARMGIRAVILTNAAGGISTEYKQGALVVITDHINLQGQNPLIGPNDDRFGHRFPDMTQAYWKPYREMALDAAHKLGKTSLSRGIRSVGRSSYETPAEIRYLRTIGADLVGMSTVPEVIVARHMGMKVLAISCVTNMAAGMLDQVLDHKEVMETGERVKGDFVALLKAVLPRIAADVDA